MKSTTDQLAKSILQKEKLDECSVEELQQLVSHYPYFGPVHLLLAEKLKAGKKSEYDVQVSKTLLYFNNPLWFHYLVNESKEEEAIPTLKKEIKEVSANERKTELEKTFIEAPEKKPENDLPVFKAVVSRIPNEDLTFEPFHTVDYFASQGIKFREEEMPADRFSQQLKSFTGWLKTMKRLGEPGGANPDLATIEKNVSHLAEHSIVDRDVNTEAMADVWIKQGNFEKAIAIYHKLSLHNPSKSPYFATKIDQLKKSN